MKKVILAVFAVVVMVASCSKENKLNRRLDGEWNVTSYGGTAMPSGYTAVLKFEKDKKGKGKFTFTQTGPTGAVTSNGTYDLEKDDKIYTLDATAGSTQDTMLVAEYSKTKLVLTDPQGSATSKIEATKK